MRVTNFQLYEIIGADTVLNDFVTRALSLYQSDNPSFTAPGKNKIYCRDMKCAVYVLDLFSGDRLEQLPDFQRYLKLVVKKMRSNAQAGSNRDDGARTAERFMGVMDKIIGGEWTWVPVMKEYYAAPVCIIQP
jgi:hypothetical protein